MSQARSRQGVFRFEKFELDLCSGELRQVDGKAVRLPEQPFQILVLMLERSGEVVAREEFRKRLWPNDTIVEFEHSISAAMNRLRQALGDSADKPHYVETLARRGYRWIVPVEWKARTPPSQAVMASAEAKTADENLTGEKVSHYRVLQILGGGGMGVVYKAEDVKLGRRVALKFLPREFSTDPAALQRFEREARAASLLEHPNICTVHEFGEHEGQPFIVMQLLEGQTIRERVESGVPLTGGELLDVAIQITEGLGAAHHSGIIHRDIKPANIFLTARGEAKILDFGVAKLTDISEPLDLASEGTGKGSSSPHTLGLTVTGKSMGTASYMSPEQVRGEKLDARTDLFSFGLLLYEMATAQRAFPGNAATRVHEAILQDKQLSPRELNASIPGGLEDIIGKSLQKDRDLRYQTSAELLADLKQLQRDLEPTPRAAGRWWLVGAAAAAVLGAAFVGGWRLLDNRAKSALPPIRVLPLVTNSGVEGRAAFSPDGRQLAFMWNGGEGDQHDVYVQLIGDSAPPVRLTRSPGAFAGWPVWSPDGHRIAFIRCAGDKGTIYVMPAVGGTERKLTEPHSCPGSFDWSADGSLLAFDDKDSPDGSNGIFLVSVQTGERRRLTTPASLEQDSEPRFSPDGRTVGFVRNHNVIVGDIFLVPLDAGEPRRLTFVNSFVPGLTWTADGSEIVFSATSREMGNNSLWRVNVHGGAAEKVKELAGVNASEPVLSRQNHRLSYQVLTTNSNIWEIRLAVLTGGQVSRRKLISSTRTQETPQYSPGGKKIAFTSDRSGSSQIWLCDSDGSNPVQLTFMDAGNNGTPRWSPDGSSIVFDSTASGVLGLYTIRAEGGSPQPLVVDSHFNAAGSFSRDGRWIYFVSDRSGEYEVWKVPASGGQPQRVTFHSGWMPMESTDGKVLYYVKTNLPTDPSNAPATLWAMPVEGGEEHLVSSQQIDLHWAVAPNGIYFAAQGAEPQARLKFLDVRTGRVTTIATIEKPLTNGGQSLAVSPDGRSILYSQQDSVSTDIMLVENFR